MFSYSYRDTARVHRLCLERPEVGNGSRFIMAATDPSGELATHELAEMLAGHFPQVSERTGRHYSCNEISSLSIMMRSALYRFR